MQNTPNPATDLVTVHYFNKATKEYIHSWETTLPLDKDSVAEAVWSTGLLEKGDEFTYEVEDDAHMISEVL